MGRCTSFFGTFGVNVVDVASGAVIAVIDSSDPQAQGPTLLAHTAQELYTLEGGVTFAKRLTFVRRMMPKEAYIW